MSDAPVNNAEPQLAPWEVKDRPGVTVVNAENFNAYVDDKMGVKPGGEEENADPEAVAEAEAAELDAKQEEQKAAEAAPKEGDIDGGKVFFNGKWVGKHDFGYRVHVKTQEAKAEAQAKIDAVAAEAKTLREEREKIAQERDALKAKYEPPPSLEIGPEPQPSQYTDIADYAKALKDWAADSARKTDAKEAEGKRAAQAQADAVKAWTERQAKAQAALPDYAEKVNGSGVKVSDQMRDAIVDSEVGPQILYHLAEHPEVAEALGKMPVRRMLVEFGKLEASLQAPAAEQAKLAPAKGNTIAEISKAPAPITPLRGSHAVDGLKFDANGNWTGTPEEWKAARRAGKIA